MRKHLKIFGEYFGHLAVGAAMFGTLMLFGGLVNALVHWFGPLIGDENFTDLMKIVEKVILYVDVVFIIWWAIYSTYRAIKEMMSHD